MALQILIENAIRHNEVSAEHPLPIWITTESGWLIVSNKLQLRPQYEPGSQTGLKNIQARYSFFTTQPVEVISGPESFTVKMPLLDKK